MHRDLKPENVLLSDTGRIALCDFGISCDFNQSVSVTTTVQAQAYSIGYNAPELTASETWKEFPFALDSWSLGCMLMELVLPLMERISGNGSSLQRTKFESFEWNEWIEYFVDYPHMCTYLRICSQLLHRVPSERMRANEALQEWLLMPGHSEYRAESRVTIVMKNLAEFRKTNTKTQAITIQLPPFTTDEALFLSVMDQLKSHVSDLTLKLRVKQQDGRSIPFCELIDIVFTHAIRPSSGLLTLNISTADIDLPIAINRAYVPTKDGNLDHFRVLSFLMAKCFVKGIRIPLDFNSLCLNYILGHRNAPKNVNESIAAVAESNSQDAILYRNILLHRQDNVEYPFEINVLGGSESEELITDENKADIISQAIWHRLILYRSKALDALATGFTALKTISGFELLNGKEIQLLMYGTEYLEIETIRNCFSFLKAEWESIDDRIEQWFIKWITLVSDCTLRRILFRCFGYFVTEIHPSHHQIFILPSPNEQVTFVSDAHLIYLPTDCSLEALELRIAKELFLDYDKLMKNGAEMRSQVTKAELNTVVGAMRREIRSGGWFRCGNGHLYAIGNCGGAMEEKICPEDGCGLVIGGENHRSAPGNVHANIDGSTHPAWG